MKKTFIVANWKSNKTNSETNEWLQRFTINDIRFTNKEIIICPPFTLLSRLKSYILSHKSPIKLGAQNISPFEEGSYTGEINGKQIREFAEYVLIGHSERRKNFAESDTVLEKKVNMAKQYKISPIFIVQDENTPIPKDVQIITYEPPSSISPGKPDDPENANRVASQIKKSSNAQYVLYGGNVAEKNVNSFTTQPYIDGVLVGRASLNPVEFTHIIEYA